MKTNKVNLSRLINSGLSALPFVVLGLSSVSATQTTGATSSLSAQVNPPVREQQTASSQTQPYLDDHSTPLQVLRSYYNAINRKEYVRAYSYWGQSGTSATSQPPDYPQFEKGYANTAMVQLSTGRVTSDGAAGSIYYQVPVTLMATLTNDSKHTYVGCYTLQQVNPQLSAVPPFKPMHINSAKIQEISNSANPAELMQQSCH